MSNPLNHVLIRRTMRHEDSLISFWNSGNLPGQAFLSLILFARLYRVLRGKVIGGLFKENFDRQAGLHNITRLRTMPIAKVNEILLEQSALSVRLANQTRIKAP